MVTMFCRFYPPCVGGVEYVAYNVAEQINCKTIFCMNHKFQLMPKVVHIDNQFIYRGEYWGRIGGIDLNISLIFISLFCLLFKKKEKYIYHFPCIQYMISLPSMSENCVILNHALPDQNKIGKTYKYLFINLVNKKTNIVVTGEKNKIFEEGREQIIPLCLSEEDEKLALECHHSTQEPTVVFVGRNCKYKGIHLLVDGWKSLVDENKNGNFRLLLIGPGTEIYNDEKFQIRGLGKISKRLMYNHLSKGCILVMPSTNNAEAFGLVQLDAAITTNIIITAEVGTESSNLFPGKEGYYKIKSNHVGQISDILERIINHKSLAQISEQGEQIKQEYFVKYSYDRIQEKWKKYLNSIGFPILQ